MSPLKRFFYDYVFGKVNFDSVLDVGAGNGEITAYFQSKGKSSHGLDLYPSNSAIMQGNILNNSLPSGGYDLVYSAHLIEHLNDNEKFVSELLRLSKRYVCVVAPLPHGRFWDQPDHIRPYTLESFYRLFHLNKAIVGMEIRLPLVYPIVFILLDKKDIRTGS